ncbi:MAG TPA: FmdB family zinc ribbon protein [Solirubrobacterales bacterium]
MPIYEYRCEDGHEFEVVQRMTEDPVTACEVCGKPVARVFSPVAVHYKGSGFYTTDYARKGKDAGGAKATESKSSDSSKGDSKPSDSSSKGSGETSKAASKD